MGSRPLRHKFDRALDDFFFGAAYVGEECPGGKRWSEPLNQIDDSDHGRGKYNYLAAQYSIGWIGVAGVDYTEFLCAFQHRRAIAAHNLPVKLALLQRERQRASY
jgi:hypothetical protein